MTTHEKDDGFDLLTQRYHTWQEAEEGHVKTIEMVKRWSKDV